jgi:hypothetical protein
LLDKTDDFFNVIFYSAKLYVHRVGIYDGVCSTVVFISGLSHTARIQHGAVWSLVDVLYVSMSHDEHINIQLSHVRVHLWELRRLDIGL